MFDKLKAIAQFAVATRFGVGSRGAEVKRIYDRFETDPAVGSVDVKRRNLAMGIPGFVEGSITTKDSLPDATFTSLALTLSDFLDSLETHAEIRPLTLTSDGVSMAVGMDRGAVEKQIPLVLEARADASLSRAEFSVKTGLLHCIVVMPDAESSPEAMEKTFVHWAEFLPLTLPDVAAGTVEATIVLRSDSGETTFFGSPTAVPVALFRVWKLVAAEYAVKSIHAAQLGGRGKPRASSRPSVTLTVTNEADIREVYDLATELLGGGTEVRVKDQRGVQLTTSSAKASTLNLVEDASAGMSDLVTNIYVSPEGRRMDFSVTGDHRLVAEDLARSPEAAAFDIVIISLSDGNSYGAPAAELVAWADSFTELVSESTATNISLRYEYCTLAYEDIPTSSEMHRTAQILYPVVPPKTTFSISPGSVAAYRFRTWEPDPKSPLQAQYKKAGDQFVKAWRVLED